MTTIVRTLQLPNELFGLGHGALRKYFRERLSCRSEGNRVAFIDMRYGAAA